MQILTENGYREVPEEEVIAKYAAWMLMPIERARRFIRVRMQGSAPYPIQGFGFLIPPGLMEDSLTDIA